MSRSTRKNSGVGAVDVSSAQAAATAAAATDASAKANTVAVAALPRTFGKNLFDKETAVQGYLWNSSGVQVVLAGFTAGALMPVRVGQQYTINNPRGILFWKLDGTFNNYVDNATLNPYTFTVAAGIGYVSYSMLTTTLAVSQMETGAAVTAFESYGITVPKQMINTVPITELSALPRTSELAVYRTGDAMAVRSAFDATRDIIHPLNLTLSATVPAVGFTITGAPQVILIPTATRDSEVWPNVTAPGLARIHETSDDNCPIQIGWSYIGGNHGYSVGTQVDLTGHGKTTADLGSLWTDGTRTFTLLEVTNVNRLVFGNPYTVASGIVTGTTGLPTGSLTHVSGATNTTTVSIAGAVANVQIFPGTLSRTLTVELDGRTVAEGKNYGDVLLVHESYLIPSYKGIIDTAQANIGTAWSTLSMPSLARVTNTYRFTRAALVTAQKVTVLERTVLNMGVTQMGPLSLPSGGSRRQFMAGVGTAGTLNLSTYATIDSLAALTEINAASFLHPLHPANRMTQWAHDSGGVAQYGIALGYLPVGDAHPGVRTGARFQPRSWFISSTLKKNYPQLQWGVTREIGETLAGTAYRRYLAPPSASTEIVVSDGTTDWVIIDRPTTVTEARMPTPRQLLNRRLVPVYPNSITVPDRVTAEGIPYAVSVAPGYGMWRADPDDARLETVPGATAKTGSYFVVNQTALATQGLTGQYQVLLLYPMYLPEASAVDRACIEVTTVGTGVLRHGVYLNDPSTGLPVLTAPLADYGTVDVTATGIKETTVAVTLPAGWHWYGQVWQVTNTTPPTLRVTSQPSGIGPMNIGSSSAAMNATRYGWSMTGVTGALGALTLAATHQLQPPHVAYRRA